MISSVKKVVKAQGQSVDGRSHNKANIKRTQVARKKLAYVVRLIRSDIRQGLVLPPHTIRGIIGLLIVISKQHLGQGFSVQFLYRHKKVLEKLQRFSLKNLQKIIH